MAYNQKPPKAAPIQDFMADLQAFKARHPELAALRRGTGTRATEDDLRAACAFAKINSGIPPGWTDLLVWNATWVEALEGRATPERVLCETCDGTGWAWDETIPTGDPTGDNFSPCPACNQGGAA